MPRAFGVIEIMFTNFWKFTLRHGILSAMVCAHLSLFMLFDETPLTCSTCWINHYKIRALFCLTCCIQIVRKKERKLSPHKRAKFGLYLFSVQFCACALIINNVQIIAKFSILCWCTGWMFILSCYIAYTCYIACILRIWLLLFPARYLSLFHDATDKRCTFL